MNIRIIADPTSVTVTSQRIARMMERSGYTLIGTTEKQSRTNPRDRICYLNFISESEHQNLNDEL